MKQQVRANWTRANAHETDVLASFEFSEAHDRKQYRSPEIRLMFAILNDAVECFQKYMFAKRKRERRLYTQAEVWIFSDNIQWIFSFVNICEELKMDPGYLRRGLKRLRPDNRRAGGLIPPPPSLRSQTRMRNPRIYA